MNVTNSNAKSPLFYINKNSPLYLSSLIFKSIVVTELLQGKTH